MPTIGRQSERHAPDEFRFPHGRHVIYYRVELVEVIIETIIYGPLITDLWGDD